MPFSLPLYVNGKTQGSPAIVKVAAHTAGPLSPAAARQKDSVSQPARKRHSLMSFPYVCPEPVLVKRSFLYINGSKSGVFRTGVVTVRHAVAVVIDAVVAVVPPALTDHRMRHPLQDRQNAQT